MELDEAIRTLSAIPRYRVDGREREALEAVLDAARTQLAMVGFVKAMNRI